MTAQRYKRLSYLHLRAGPANVNLNSRRPSLRSENFFRVDRVIANRMHSCTYGDEEPYSVAVLNVSDSPIAEGIELSEPQLLMLGDQALIFRGYERLTNDDGPFTVL